MIKDNLSSFDSTDKNIVRDMQNSIGIKNKEEVEISMDQAEEVIDTSISEVIEGGDTSLSKGSEGISVRDDIETEEVFHFFDDNFIDESDTQTKQLDHIKNGKIKISTLKIEKLVNQKARQLNLEQLRKLSATKGGFLSYLVHKNMLGNFEELLELEVLESALKSRLLSQFEPEKLYTILINLIYIEDGRVWGTSPMQSIIITAESNVSLIARTILNKLKRASNEYDIKDHSCQVQVIWREWLPEDEYSKLKSPIERTQIIDEILQDEADLKLDTDSKLRKIKKFMKLDDYDHKLEGLPEFDSIIQLPKYDYLNASQLTGDNKMLDFILNIEKENEDVKVLVFKSGNPDLSVNDELLYFVFEYTGGKKRVICETDVKSWETSLIYWNTTKYPYFKWTDEVVDENNFTRIFGDYKFHISNGSVMFYEKFYNFPDMIMSQNDKIRDHKIGALDLETYSSEENGLGKLEVYAGGCALSDGYQNFYYRNEEEGLNSGRDIMVKMFKDLFLFIFIYYLGLAILLVVLVVVLLWLVLWYCW